MDALNAQVEQFLTSEMPAMADSGEITDAQLFESLGVIGLWTRAVVGPHGGGREITEVVEAFVLALRETYPNDTLSFPERTHAHVEEAFRENPALIRFRSYVEKAVGTAPQDDASRSAVSFLSFATLPESGEQVNAYFEVLLGGL